MDTILRRQLSTKGLIERVWDNLVKVGKERITSSYLRARLELLESYWTKFGETHFLLLEYAEVEASEYTRKDMYLQTEDSYITAKSRIISGLREDTSSSDPASDSLLKQIQLPKISLPVFSGDPLAWEGFRDLFKSLVHDIPGIPPVQKLQYLKASLTGEAAASIANMEISAAGYRVAWDELVARYDNKRVLLATHMRALLSSGPVAKASSTEIKRLISVVNQAVRSFRSLHRSVDDWDDWFVHILVEKLDSSTRLLWEASLHNSTDFPAFNELLDFLHTRVRALDAAGGKTAILQSATVNKVKQERNSGVSALSASTTATSASKRCSRTLCQGLHTFSYCTKFKALSIAQRRKHARNGGACFNCLKNNHRAASCPSNHRCLRCQEKHHTLLHISSATTTADHTGSVETNCASTDLAGKASTSTATVTSNVVSLSTTVNKVVLLATAQVVLEGPRGQSTTVRVLLDSGSEASFVTDRVVHTLGLSRQRIRVPITGLQGALTGVAIHAVTIRSPSSPSMSLDLPRALVLSKLTSLIPATRIHLHSWPHLNGLSLADPNYAWPATVDAILGADIYGSLLRDDAVHRPPGTPSAQLTVLGWVLMGSVTSQQDQGELSHQVSVHHALAQPSLDCELQRFWELEEVSSKRIPTPDEVHCEEVFTNSHTRDKTGRYIVRLPKREQSGIHLRRSRPGAAKILLSVERRLARDPTLRLKYSAFLSEYLAQGHMERVPDQDVLCDDSYYLPHHAVIKTTDPTGKIRVVFNASFRTPSGYSLNDLLLPGPKLQSDLWLVLTRWRLFRFAFATDIIQMFRQIRIHNDDVNLQRIVWRADPVGGVARLPLHNSDLAQDERSRYPLGAIALETNSYVDDILAGADSLEQALEVRRQLTEILRAGGFQLSKWAANTSELCPDGDAQTRLFSDMSEVSTLGILWTPKSDSFGLRVAPSLPSLTACTKRSVLSDVARFFDPLGWAAPVLIFGKIFMQELWMAKLELNQPLPLKLQTRWTNFASCLPSLNSIRIPRVHYTSVGCLAELHGFSDASSRAYAAAVYLRCADDSGSTSVNLLVAKTNVAPVKTTSIPRLELCGAVLLARLLDATVKGLGLASIPIYAWTDAEVVLAWLATHPSKWNVFVANRVAAIQELVPPERWRHVPTDANPADAATRGIAPAELSTLTLWWNGPPWLAGPPQDWPERISLTKGDKDEELRPIMVQVAHTPEPNDVLLRFSTLSRLLRISALCLRFLHNFQHPEAKRIGFITSSELNFCRLRWIRLAQCQDFDEELKALGRGQPLSRRSPLLTLRPFLSQDGLLRVGGRLQRSLLPYEEKYPLILAKRNHLSLLLVREAHVNSLHGGSLLMRSLLLCRYWIIHAASLARCVKHSCVRCTRFRAEVARQQMGQPPTARVQASRPFLSTGVDFAGPIQLRSTKGRGHKSYKGYIALFICLASKAIHLETVSDLTTASFLAAFKRFVARRGHCGHLFNDNGTNFRGADPELRALFHAASEFYKEIEATLANDGTVWTFIPPAAPHFGGLWEAGVKVVKYHLRRIVGDHTLTYEEMATLLCQIKACLNSRPLYPISNDPSDLSALTPGHLLIGEPLINVPEPPLLDAPASHVLSRWAQISRMRDRFWNRWSSEYVHHLQQLSKWKRTANNHQVGDLVLIKDELQPPTKWALARVTATHPGPDGLVRVVTLKAAKGILKRPIAKVCHLPVTTTPNRAV